MLSQTRLFAVVLVTLLGYGVQDALAESALGTSTMASDKVKTVKKFNPAKSQLPEGIALDKQGNIYVGFYPTGQIWKITPNGDESVFSTLDVGSSGGGMVGFEMDEEDNLYVCDASFESATQGIWKVDPNGMATLFAKLDPTGFPNDLVFDKDGNLFVTDSYLGEIWKISVSGEVEAWLQDRLLDPLFAYGANGIEFDRGDLFVANTDQGSIVRIRMSRKGGPPHAELFVQSPVLVGADGISFDRHHNLYATVDYQNTLLAIDSQGQIQSMQTIQTLAAAGAGLDFPADTAFGQSHGQRTFLFWTNGGYNFNKPSVQKLNVGDAGEPLP
jgi:sugar lactone lactonase YvrE